MRGRNSRHGICTGLYLCRGRPENSLCSSGGQGDDDCTEISEAASCCSREHHHQGLELHAFNFVLMGHGGPHSRHLRSAAPRIAPQAKRWWHAGRAGTHTTLGPGRSHLNPLFIGDQAVCVHLSNMDLRPRDNTAQQPERLGSEPPTWRRQRVWREFSKWKEGMLDSGGSCIFVA